MMRPARPPTRRLVITCDAPPNAPAGEAVVSTVNGRALRASIASAGALTIAHPSGSGYYRTHGSPGNELDDRHRHQLPQCAHSFTGVGPLREPLRIPVRRHEDRHPFHNLAESRISIHLRIPTDVEGGRDVRVA